MKEWYLNTPTPNICSGYESDEIKDYGVSNFSDVIYTNFSDPVVKCNHDKTAQTMISVIIQGVVEDNVTSTTKRQLLCVIGSFYCGDYVYFEDNYWLVVVKPSNNKIYEKAIVEICTYAIKFQSLSGTILSYPCIDETINSVGIDETNTINTLNGIHRIKLPFDDNTKLLDIDRRLFVDDLSVNKPKTFAITDPNRTEFRYGDKGLIVLTMKSSVLQETDGELPKDRPDLGICNYFEPEEPYVPPENNIYTYAEIICSNPSNELVIGSSVYRTLTPTFYEPDGTTNTDTITAVWSWGFNGIDQSNFDIQYEGNLAKIRVVENYDLFDKTITASVMGSNGGYSGSITLTISI